MVDYRARAREIALEEGVSPDLFEKLVGAESSFNPRARSSAGAQGLGQLMPGTARDLGVDPNDPEQNLRGSARYLRQMQDRFKSTPLALAAYNAGPGRVSRSGGIPRIAETEAYVAKINAGDDDSDIFGSPAGAQAVAAPAGPSIRQGEDGVIEIDINEGRGAPDSPFGDDADIFAMSSAPAALVAAPQAAPVAAEPYNKAVFGEIAASFGGAKDRLAQSMAEGRAQDEKVAKQGVVKSILDLPMSSLKRAGREISMVGDVAGMAFSPIDGATKALAIKPAVQALEKILPRARSQPKLAEVVAELQGKPFVSRELSEGENRALLEQGISSALSAGMPIKGAKGLPKMPVRSDRRVASALERAAVRDQTTLGDVAAKARATPDVPAFQSGGENMLGLTEVVAQSPGKGSTIVTKAVRDDRAAASRRVKDSIASGLGGKNDYFETLDNVVAKRKLDADTGMAAMEAKPVKLDQGAVQALRSDLAKTAIRDAARNALASTDETTRLSGAALNRIADEVLDKPGDVSLTIRNAQDISKSLLDAANTAYSGGDGARGKALKGLGRAVRDNAGDPAKGGVKEYGDWLKAYGDESDHIEALELGRDILSGKRDMSAERLKKTVDEMSDTSRDFFRKGAGEAVLMEARSKGSINAMRRTLKEEIGDRVKIAFPDEASYKAFMDAAETEVLREAGNNRVINNSRTFGRAAAAEDLKTADIDGADVASAAADIISLNLPSMGAKAFKSALKNLPRKDRSILGDPVTNEVIGRALADPDEMTRLLNVLEAVKARRNAPLSRKLEDLAPKVVPALSVGGQTTGSRQN